MQMPRKYRDPRTLRASSRVQICELCHRASKRLYLVDLFMACEECWTVSRLDSLPPKVAPAKKAHRGGTRPSP